MAPLGSGKHLRLDLFDERLWDGDRVIPLRPRPFSVLRCFVLSPNRLLTLEEILEQVWPETYVTSGLVKGYVLEIRRALGDNPKEPEFIETVHGRGYRYIGDIEVSGTPRSSQTGDDVWSFSHPDKPTIAVLPFDNLSGDTREGYFSDGIADTIITELSRFRSLFVIARHSSFTYKARSFKIQEVGKDLGVQYVVEGSVRKSGSRLRVTAQLIEAESGRHFWAERYDRNLADIFSIEDEISQRIVATLADRVEHVSVERAKRKLTRDLALQ